VLQTRIRRADAASIHVAPGLPDALDRLAEAGCATRAFLRTAWLGAGEDAGGAQTLVVSRGDGRPLAALPAALLGPALLGARGVPGSYWPFRSVPLAPEATADDLADAFADTRAEAALGAVWRLGPVYADDRAATLIRRGATRAGWTVLSRTLGPTYLLDLTRKRPRARRLAAYRRQLEAAGSVRFACVSGAGWDAGTWDALAAVEANSWVGCDTDGSGAKFLRPEQRDRWRRAVADPAIARALSATLLFLEDRPLAFSFDLAAGPVQYAIAGSFDRRFAQCRPGHLVTAHQLAQAAAAGIATVDLGAGDSGYKRAMGAVAGTEIVDLLFVRNRSLAQLLTVSWGGLRTLGPELFRAPYLSDGPCP
jgi:CelD/BcsL family acetyltransferase involved in cellulose biosynthesis